MPTIEREPIPTAIAIEPVQPYCPLCGMAIPRPESLASRSTARTNVPCSCGALVVATFWKPVVPSVFQRF